MTTRQFWCALVIVAVGSVSACDDDSDAGRDGGDLNASTAMALIGPSGGSVTLADGAKVEIPAGALSDATPIKITRIELEDVAPMPDTVESRGKPYAFEPHGTLFLEPVKITVPFTGASTQVRPFKLDDEDDQEWSLVTDDTKQGTTISIDSMSFSVIAAAAVL